MSQWEEFQTPCWASAVNLSTNILDGSKVTQKGIRLLAVSVIEKEHNDKILQTKLDNFKCGKIGKELHTQLQIGDISVNNLIDIVYKLLWLECKNDYVRVATKNLSHEKNEHIVFCPEQHLGKINNGSPLYVHREDYFEE